VRWALFTHQAAFPLPLQCFFFPISSCGFLPSAAAPSNCNIRDSDSDIDIKRLPSISKALDCVFLNPTQLIHHTHRPTYPSTHCAIKSTPLYCVQCARLMHFSQPEPHCVGESEYLNTLVSLKMSSSFSLLLAPFFLPPPRFCILPSRSREIASSSLHIDGS